MLVVLRAAQHHAAVGAREFLPYAARARIPIADEFVLVPRLDSPSIHHANHQEDLVEVRGTINSAARECSAGHSSLRRSGRAARTFPAQLRFAPAGSSRKYSHPDLVRRSLD